ncbi:MAG: hypothetical protein EBZ49_00760 [Proteobacteria bacterium]|nr:hypothetical protein [Pseudomonadota bacterium]
MGSLRKKANAKKAAGIANTLLGYLAEASATPDGSLTKTVTPSKQDKVSVQITTPQDLMQFREAFLSEGFAKHPVTTSQTKVAADFYRRGGIRNSDNPQNSFFELPRSVDDSGQDEPASIRLIGKNPPGGSGDDVDLIPPFSKFFLENVQEPHTERSQIVETFGNFYVFFFGERPPIYNFSGTLLNTNNLNWVEDYMFYYENFLRGTKCVDLQAKLVLTYGYHQVEGFLLNTSLNTTAVIEKGVSVSFQVLVIDRKVLKLSTDFGLVESNGQFSKDISFLNLLVKGLSKPETSDATKFGSGALNKKNNPSKLVAALGSQVQSLSNKFKTKLVSGANGFLRKVIG